MDEDIVGFFVDNECRGTSYPFSFNGFSFVSMNLQSETTETGYFLIYDYDEDKICNGADSLLVVPGQQIGTPTDPFIINSRCCVNVLTLKSNLGPLYGEYAAVSEINFSMLDQIVIPLNGNVILSAPLVKLFELSHVNNAGEVIVKSDGCVE